MQKQQNYFKKPRTPLLIIRFTALRPESENFLPYMIIITSNTYLPTRLFNTTRFLIFPKLSFLHVYLEQQKNENGYQNNLGAKLKFTIQKGHKLLNNPHKLLQLPPYYNIIPLDDF